MIRKNNNEIHKCKLKGCIIPAEPACAETKRKNESVYESVGILQSQYSLQYKLALYYIFLGLTSTTKMTTCEVRIRKKRMISEWRKAYPPRRNTLTCAADSNSCTRIKTHTSAYVQRYHGSKPFYLQLVDGML
jgi:hypothetical protein